MPSIFVLECLSKTAKVTEGQVRKQTSGYQVK